MLSNATEGTVKKDLHRLGLTWKEAETAAVERRVASECSRVHPHVCGLSEGQAN